MMDRYGRDTVVAAARIQSPRNGPNVQRTPSSSGSASSSGLTGAPDPPVYGLDFWLCYVGNTSLMIAVSVLFRYSDFVITYLGGSEFQLGLVVGVGMVGALAMRLFQGRGIDHYGPRRIWLGSLLAFIVAMLLHLGVHSAFGPGIFLARILMMISLAGAFGASLAYISLRVPEGRIAEMVGMLGTSGFVGLAVGPVLGDLIFQQESVTGPVVNRMFLCAAGMGLLSLICVGVATRKTVRRRKHRRSPPLLWLIKRYHPGPLLVVAAAMGLAVTLPHTFLRPYTARLGIDEIRNFFLVYSATAFVVRVSTRRLTERLGFAPVILVGLLSAAGGTMLYLTVSNQWTLGIPAVLLGVSHALLFPAVVAAGSISFPSRYRGVATTLTLGMFDLGNLFGQPAVGALLVWSESVGLPPYTTMFCVVATLMAASGIFYFSRRRGVETSRAIRRDSNSRLRGRAAKKRAEPAPAETELPDSAAEAEDDVPPWKVEPALSQASGNER